MRKGSQLFVEKTIDKGRHIWHFSGMKNPLLEKTVWDGQDAAVAADWAMERGVFGADLWRCFPPEFVRCLAECPELLAAVGVLTSLDGAWAWAWARAGAGWPFSVSRARAGAGAWAWAGARAQVRARAGTGGGARAWARVGAQAQAQAQAWTWAGTWPWAGSGSGVLVGNSWA